ncbi:LmeA family phospholipid-binding protein [Protaetiibacter intestinalis]|uniref:LmeA family phospholipid-binding protein n=1 Tax=Protaetiibacter intestinalis TaxID=2419774 RepID=UPI00130032AD|nr:DUF2993 domain-containing protein [Protaetiibacter intestinalis]
MTAGVTSPAPLPRRRRAWPWVLGGIVLLVAGAAVAVDLLARGYAEDLIADRVADALDVPAGTPVEVDLGGGSILLQALGGSIDEVGIRVDALGLGPLSGDLAIDAEGVPIDPAQPTRALTASFTIPEAALQGISSELSGVPIDSVTLAEPEIVADGTVSVFGLSLPLGLGLTPGVADGAIAFTVTSIRIGDQQLDTAALTGDPVWGAIAGTVLQQRSVCIADRLPDALTLADADVVGGTLRVVLDGSGAPLADYDTKGTCPAS